ncbi:DUF2283 domain-containing protein [Leifsonia sp. 2MCAF36]|uniref:DUF2283 domain-containing protein n=1 Tax=Leifsonia sp. 2MCAF36 TaxID=3232988 RepID=UPI003F995D5E
MVVDTSVDAAYLYLSTKREGRQVATTQLLVPDANGGMVNLDFDSEGHLVGIELIPASQFLRGQDIASALAEQSVS